MPITSAMIAGVLRTARTVLPDGVVSCSYAYTDSGGTVQSWSGTGLALNLSRAAQYLPDGQWIQDGLTLLLDVADLPPRRPQEKDIVEVRRGDDTSVSYVVKASMTSVEAMLNLTLEKRYL